MNLTKHFQRLAASAALLLTGCSMMPVYERPAAPIAADWPALSATAATPASESAASASAAADTEWQE
ncbi:MAG: multidrug transporter, partial [Polaromonas sp.]|nr:multidrug transporter [Polaromonas sp.]